MEALHDDGNVTHSAPAPSAACGAASRRDVSSLNGRERVGLQLAARYGMTAAAVAYGGSDRAGHEHLLVASRTSLTGRYELVYDPASDTVQSCTCPARGGCWHIGVVREWVERCHREYERTEVYREQDDAGEVEAMRQYERKEA